jgi:hypothetical protein
MRDASLQYRRDCHALRAWSTWIGSRPSGYDTYDKNSETTVGIGPLVGSRVEVAGTGGGIVIQRTLSLTTSQDGWVVAKTLLPTSPHEEIFLYADGSNSRRRGATYTARLVQVTEPLI